MLDTRVCDVKNNSHEMKNFFHWVEYDPKLFALQLCHARNKPAVASSTTASASNVCIKKSISLKVCTWITWFMARCYKLIFLASRYAINKICTTNFCQWLPMNIKLKSWVIESSYVPSISVVANQGQEVIHRVRWNLYTNRNPLHCSCPRICLGCGSLRVRTTSDVPLQL